MTGDERRAAGDAMDEGRGTGDDRRDEGGGTGDEGRQEPPVVILSEAPPTHVILSEAKDLLVAQSKTDPSATPQDDSVVITRRRALQVLGAVPASLAFGVLPEQHPRSRAPVSLRRNSSTRTNGRRYVSSPTT